MYILYFKRMFDLIMSVVLLIITAVPMLIIALAIKLTSDGPAFFKQERIGKDSIPFTIFKFRSMSVGTKAISAQNRVDGDVHITRVGHFLRKTSLDELPQLFNILKGDMSFIGPRPLAEVDAETIQLRKKNGADQVRPGITGLAQVSGRNLVNSELKAFYDGEYSQNITLLNDARIIILTLRIVIAQEGIDSEKNK